MNIVKKYFWKIVLIANNLTKDDEMDYYAECLTINTTATNRDIAAKIVAERSEYRLDTIFNILEQGDAIAREMLLNGRAVSNRNFHMAPRPKGRWSRSRFIPDYKRNRASVAVTLTSDFRKKLLEVGFDVLGLRNNVAYINSVTDVFTESTDGIITPDSYIRIVGDRIKIVPAATATNEEGLYFVDTAGVRTKVIGRMADNKPKSILGRVPALPVGQYTLEIVTFFSGNSVKPLSTPRTITYSQPLKVVSEHPIE